MSDLFGYWIVRHKNEVLAVGGKGASDGSGGGLGASGGCAAYWSMAGETVLCRRSGRAAI